jgi:hypothetical protein
MKILDAVGVDGERWTQVITIAGRRAADAAPAGRARLRGDD